MAHGAAGGARGGAGRRVVVGGGRGAGGSVRQTPRVVSSLYGQTSAQAHQYSSAGGMGSSHSVPGSSDVKVRISSSYQAAHMDTAYSRTLQGYITEIEWHYISSSLATVVADAGSAEREESRTFCFFACMVVMIISFMTTTIMTPIGCALGGWGLWCQVGVGTGALGVVSLIVFLVLGCMGAAAGRRWTSAAIQAVDARLLPDLRARHPGMIFELRELQEHGFEVHIERRPEGRDSLGQVVVAALAVEPTPPALVASAPPPAALGGKSQSGGKGLGAPLLHG